MPDPVVDLAREIASKLDPEFDRFAAAIERDPSTVEHEIDGGVFQLFVTTPEKGREWFAEIAVADLLPPPR